MMKLFCISVIVFCAIVIVVGIVKIHELPGDIALKRGHPQAEAIRICSLLGLLIFPFWMLALLWAYMRPVFKPVALDSVPADSATEAAISADGGTA
jgi:uncharacterized membrane protein